MSWKIPLFKIYWDKKDIAAVTSVIRSGMYWAEGYSIEEFEEKIAEYIGRKYCVVFNSGTSALHATLLAYGIKSGDEVIVPSFTFIATANAPLFVGAKPVFTDIEEETFGLDPEDVKRKITSRTKAIMPVHYGGCPCRIKELRRIADKYKLFLIEDAAESFGAMVGGKKVGTFGHAAMLSFCQNKIITTGEGGAIVTDSKGIYENLKLIRSHGRTDHKNYFSSTHSEDYITLGYNFRISSLQAVLGVAQLKKINKIIKQRIKKAHYLTDRLNREVEGVITPSIDNGYLNVYQLYTIRVVKYRDALKDYLASRGIMTKLYFYPVHLTEFYRRQYKCKLPITEKIAGEALSLPMYPTLNRKDMDYIVSEIRKFLKEKK